jgi:bifunctional non-homologous end joining protein LigD
MPPKSSRSAPRRPPPPLPSRRALPKIDPIVPVLRSAPFNDPAWLFEPKYDGFRGMVYLTRKCCTIYSKRGNPMARFRDLGEQLRAELPQREVILDGEVISIDQEGRINFWDLMRGRGVFAYAAFDVLWLNGRDLRDLPLTQRKKRLERLIPAAVGALNRVPCFEDGGRELLEAACRLDLEGIVAKRKVDPYGPKTAWYKIKNPTYTTCDPTFFGLRGSCSNAYRRRAARIFPKSFPNGKRASTLEALSCCGSQRRRSESNRRWRFCRPLPYHLATAPR